MSRQLWPECLCYSGRPGVKETFRVKSLVWLVLCPGRCSWAPRTPQSEAQLCCLRTSPCEFLISPEDQVASLPLPGNRLEHSLLLCLLSPTQAYLHSLPCTTGGLQGWILKVPVQGASVLVSLQKTRKSKAKEPPTLLMARETRSPNNMCMFMESDFMYFLPKRPGAVILPGYLRVRFESGFVAERQVLRPV